LSACGGFAVTPRRGIQAPRCRTGLLYTPALSRCAAWRRLADPTTTRRIDMTVARITEISSISTKSFDDAVAQGIARAHKTLKHVQGAWVKDHKVECNEGKVTGYKVILKVTFVLED
jgi:hypothetical protein